MAPVVPGFTTQTDRLEATIRAIADHGAAFMGANLLYLKGGTKDHFMGFLDREFPEMVSGYTRLYPRAYAPSGYAATVRSAIDALQKRYEVSARAKRVPADAEPAAGADDAARQGSFSWLDDE